MKTPLKKDQEKVVALLSKKKRALLCEKTGKGKTLAVLAAYSILKKRGYVDYMIVLTPRNTYEGRVWESECKKHTSLKPLDLEKVKGLYGVKSPQSVSNFVEAHDVIYGKHSHVKNSLELLKSLNKAGKKVLVVLDEIHHMKNPVSSLTLGIREFVTGSYALWGMTATPLSKNLEDTFHIVNLVKPGSLGTFDWFRDTICTTSDVYIKTKYGRKKVQKIDGVLNRLLLDNLLKDFVIKGSSELTPNFFKLKYNLTLEESRIYKKIANGQNMVPGKDDVEWLTKVMTSEDTEIDSIKAIDVHSSRFIYLQYAADGIVRDDGRISGYGNKIEEVIKVVEEKKKLGQSVILYFDYYHTLDIVKSELSTVSGLTVLESSGRKTIGPQDINEAKVKNNPYALLVTKAGAASISYYYINNIILVHVPTVPETLIQVIGRITRIDTLFPGNLNVYIVDCENIDEYKLRVVSKKTEQMEIVAGDEANLPDWYRGQSWSEKSVQTYKKYFLWK